MPYLAQWTTRCAPANALLTSSGFCKGCRSIPTHDYICVGSIAPMLDKWSAPTGSPRVVVFGCQDL
jgi:hypothetical protein